MKSRRRIYLDYNATTPVDEEVLLAMLPFFRETYGNPSSADHPLGWAAAEAVEQARESVAEGVGARASAITFTSGATEAANLALWGYAKGNRTKGNHIVSCTTEHRAVLDTLKAMEASGFRITLLKVDEEGRIDPGILDRAITPDTLLVSLMIANNETGVIHPLAEFARICHSKGVPLMTDATQALGKVPVDLGSLGVDMAVFSAHKLYGPKGAGALYVRKESVRGLQPFAFGGGQEKGLRPGTLNVPAIVGFGRACELAVLALPDEARRIAALRQFLEEELGKLEGTRINGSASVRLPNTLSISFEGVDGTRLIRSLQGIAISRGSACSSNSDHPSHVLTAMGLDARTALATLRISLGRETTEGDIQAAAAEIRAVVGELKSATA